MEGRYFMENRPMGREKRVAGGGSGIKRSGKGIGKMISERNVKRDKEAENRQEDGKSRQSS